MSLFLTCEETNDRLSDYLDGHLAAWERFKVWLHLLFCPTCTAILATMKVLPDLVASLETDPSDAARREAEAVLDRALARISAPGPVRPWPVSPVPEGARELLDTHPDLPLSILAAAHRSVALGRACPQGPYHLPMEILDQLPPESQWRWVQGAGGRRRAELLQDPHGQKLVLAYTPPGLRARPHRHLGSESVLVLAGSLQDQGVTLTPGDWVHHPTGSVHAPAVPEEDCWCLIREEGNTEGIGPLDKLKRMREAS